MKAIFPLLATAAMVLTGCSVSADKDDAKGAKVSVSVSDKEDGDSVINIDSDKDGGKFELKLPGGIQANVKVPEGMGGNTHFDIDGVGLYPGAKVGSVNVRAFDGNSDSKATVKIGFTAPADAAAVADWYQQQFAAKKVSVSRSGDTLSGKTEDGDDFTLGLEKASAGGAQGLLTIMDRKKD